MLMDNDECIRCCNGTGDRLTGQARCLHVFECFERAQLVANCYDSKCKFMRTFPELLS